MPWPEGLPPGPSPWRLRDDRQQVVRTGEVPNDVDRRKSGLALGRLEVGWYQLECGPAAATRSNWTSLAVLRRLRAPAPADTPVAVDSAPAWFARDDARRQEQLANLAALTGVHWIRDRLRWSELQPEPGPLRAPPTTYDTSADAHQAAGVSVLQVFHDTPRWAREEPDAGGRFAPDLRVIHDFAKDLAIRFRGRVAAWEPWNEANVATFGGHTVDQMCSWQKAAWLGFKAGDPTVTVGWNATAAVPTPAHTEGILANEAWPYFDTYNIHTYDWSHGYPALWAPTRDAASGRPIWITEADRGTPHQKNPPWYDQEPRLERLKAEWLPQAYALSLFAGARRHFHFILGNYQEPNGVQFGLLRLDLTPRPAYVALATVGRCLAGARILGRWQPAPDVHVYAFRARPDGIEHDVLVAWTEREVDWDERGRATAAWNLPASLTVQEVIDYLGRSRSNRPPATLTSAPVFVLLPVGQAAQLPLELPPPLAPWRSGDASPVVLQLSQPRSNLRRVEDVPWSEGYVYAAPRGEVVPLHLLAYNFGTARVAGRLRVERQPTGWEVTLAKPEFDARAGERVELSGTVRLPAGSGPDDGWVTLKAECGAAGSPALAFRFRVSP